MGSIVQVPVDADRKLTHGLDAAKDVSGHSLRAGFVTESATQGLQTSARNRLSVLRHHRVIQAVMGQSIVTQESGIAK